LYLRSAEAFRELSKAYSPLTQEERSLMAPLLYNEACTYAVEGRPREALKSLTESVDAGFAEEELAGTDKELDPIREKPEFAGLLERIGRNAQSAAEDKARRLAYATIPFSFHFALPDIDGKTVTLDEFKGRITIVTFWGTWCAPCRREAERYMRLLARQGDRDLKVVGIAYEHVDIEDGPAAVRAFVRERAIPYPCLIGDDKTREQVPGFLGYPTTIYLDPEQTVRVVAVGECSLREMEAIVELVRRLEAEQK
jgi:thiol-disulfide isomerase/thioredoxin